MDSEVECRKDKEKRTLDSGEQKSGSIQDHAPPPPEYKMVLSSIKHALFLALIAFGGGAGIQRGRLGRVFNPKIPRIGEGGYPNVGTRAVMSTLERKRSGRGVTRGQRGGDKGYIEALREKKLKFRRLTGTDEDVAKNAM
eukprot:1325263-Amorphochlora_amoeboformis.AAC.1